MSSDSTPRTTSTPSTDRVDAMKNLISELKTMPPAVQKDFREALGASGSTQHRRGKRRLRNEDVKNTVLSGGEAIHGPDFRPVPPQHVVDAGPEAEQIFVNTWEEGLQIGEQGGFSSELIEHLTSESESGAIPGR
jgi:hypothetical protein